MACWPCLPDFLDPGTHLPQHTHIHPANLWPSVCRPTLGNTVSGRQQLCPKLVCLLISPGLPAISFENIIHLIRFWQASFTLSLPELLHSSPFSVYLHSQIVSRGKPALKTVAKSVLRFIIPTERLVLIFKCLHPKCIKLSRALMF